MDTIPRRVIRWLARVLGTRLTDYGSSEYTYLDNGELQTKTDGTGSTNYDYDEKGNLKHQTNNVFSYKNDEMDKLTVAYRNAETREEKKDLGIKIQKIIHDEGVFIPGYSREFERIACWRWMRWPDSEETRFCPVMTSYPYESYVYWIDDDIKRETKAAMKRGETFPEVERVFDDYRTPVRKGGGSE